jgi:small-conductance mechanosensitive channel
VPSTLISARSWRAVAALVLAVAAAITSGLAGERLTGWSLDQPATRQLIAAGGAAAFCLLAVAATVGFSRAARDLLEPRTGTAHAAVARYTIVLAGGLATVIVTLELFRVPVGNLLLGGAFTAVLIGIAAQQTLGNLFAGLMLMLARPFSVGDLVRMQAGALGGEIQGTVTDIGITYVRLDTTEGTLSVPNAQALAAVVGPLRAADPPDPDLPDPDPGAGGGEDPAHTAPGTAAPVTAAAAAAAATGPGAGTLPPAGSGSPAPGPGDGAGHQAEPKRADQW